MPKPDSIGATSFRLPFGTRPAQIKLADGTWLDAVSETMDAATTIAVIEAYERERGPHASGPLSSAILGKIAEFAPDAVNQSIETGCGSSTILLSQLSKRHLCFTFNDAALENGSLGFVRGCRRAFRPDRVEFIFGPTQVTLPQHRFEASLDIAVIDGAHAYPFPELDYFYIYPWLARGALLVIDDIHIPTIARMYEFLREDEMFEDLHIEATTAFLRRTEAATFPPLGDEWNRQNYNRKRFPVVR